MYHIFIYIYIYTYYGHEESDPQSRDCARVEPSEIQNPSTENEYMNISVYKYIDIQIYNKLTNIIYTYINI